jgi:uncharacterized membrane protein YeaQ/YmgE (transglycosylase-associated protein family)
MSPGFGILWICVGAIEGWFGSKIMGTYARPRALANISIGALGALVVGFAGQHLGRDRGHVGVLVGAGGALLGGCFLLLIFGWRALSRRQV